MQITGQNTIDFEEFINYSKPGPRYTSYPTALEFDNFSANDYIQTLKNQDKSKPLSLYFHLPFCKSACYFCGCSSVFTNNSDRKDKYIKYIKKEIDILSQHLDTSRVVSQMHFGGGTPTFFSKDNLDELITHIRSVFKNFDKDPEISCEVDPRYFNEDIMKVLAKGGFNRISFGVQDFDESVQKSVNRVQEYELVKNVFDIARKYEVKSINTDLIYGLPYQSVDSFRETILKTLSLNPDRLAIFNYAHMPWLKPAMTKIDENTLPLTDEKMKILSMTIDIVTEHGYKMIGMDHFAKPDDELFRAIEKNELYRNFQGYTTKGNTDLIGIGVTSIGYTKMHYIQNEKDLKAYEAAIDNNTLPTARGITLNKDDQIRQKVILDLMSNFNLDFSIVEKEFNIIFRDYFKKELEELQEFVDKNLIKITNSKMQLLNQTAIMVIRNIAMVFDVYMKNKAKNRTFSKTI